MTSAKYSPPVEQLLIYGDCRQMDFENWHNYPEELGITSEHIPELIRMATDADLREFNVDEPQCWASVHAWRILGQLRAEAAIEPLMSLFHEQEEDEWMSEEMPIVYAMISQTAISALTAYLADSSHGTFPRTTASNCLTRIGQTHPDARSDCVATITQQLELFNENEPDLNGFLICSLIRLKAVESAPVIERAFAAKRVDEFIPGKWESVQVALGLKEAEEVPQQQFNKNEVLEYLAIAGTKPPTTRKNQSPGGFASGASHFCKRRKRPSRLSLANNDGTYLSSCSPSKDTSTKLSLRESIVFSNSKTMVLLTTPITALTWVILPALPKCLYLLSD